MLGRVNHVFALLRKCISERRVFKFVLTVQSNDIPSEPDPASLLTAEEVEPQPYASCRRMHKGAPLASFITNLLRV